MNVFDKDKILLLWTPQMGLVVRQDGVLKYISKGVDASQELVDGEYEWRENHLDQPTASLQPRLVGGIAPNSRVAASNQNGEARYFTHPEISFGATDAWSLTFAFKYTRGTNDYETISASSGGNSAITFSWGSLKVLTIRNVSGAVLYTFNTNSLINKTSIITLSAYGNELKVYKNGELFNTYTYDTSISFQKILYSGTGDYPIYGCLYYYKIQSGALAPEQVLAEYNLLRSMYPEIESVDIGTQTWATRNFEAVATPLGNVIANVTDNADWANATNLYNAAYAAHVGTAAEKEYAALKEAAMWRYPNNSIDKGAWGGKLYNKYAMMLLSLDMASANFGYHIPTNAEVVELLAQVGGDTNKLKYVGLDYWNDAIGTNESGLTLLGTGVITPGGVYTGEKELTGFWTSDSNEFPTSGLPIRIVKNV